MPSFSFEVEYAKSARGGCKKCKEKIDKDHVKVGIKNVVADDAETSHFGPSWHHFDCFSQAKGQVWFKKHLTAEAANACVGLDALKSEDRDIVAELFKACRGEGPMPTAPVPPVAASNDTPAKVSKKRKSTAEDAAEGTSAKAPKVAVVSEPVLTEAQLAAISEAKAKLASKNAAYLGMALTKNGLPKAGRKDELIDRVAENQVLGVPPTCDVCDKKKLIWSSKTGKFSCAGYFDDETKAFKRCKGPLATELTRTPWQELGA